MAELTLTLNKESRYDFESYTNDTDFNNDKSS